MSTQTRNLDRVSFAQKSRLTDYLRQLVRSYPKGVGIIHEFVQNADDAGASTVSIVLDERAHRAVALPSPAMGLLQGPALVVVNDAPFTDEDWERIQSTGRSAKVLDASKTGRFGLGFNSVYNVTDWPGILTRDRIGFFDPHGATIDGASRDEPGAAWKLTPDLWDECADLLAPFEEHGLAIGADAIPHTVFRLPLRNDSIAGQSEICDQAFTRENFDSLVRKMVDEAGELLLFLKHLTTISVRAIAPDGQPTELVTIRTSNVDEVAEGRTRVHQHLTADYRAVLGMLGETDPDDLVTEYEHHVLVERDGKNTVEQTWSVVQALVAGPDDELLAVSKRMYDYDEKAVPLVGAAALVRSANGEPLHKGRLFCTLPLSSVSSHMPFHINGFFDLQSDRQGIFADEGAEGKAAIRVKWNRSLLQFGCSEVAARLLARIADGIIAPKDLYHYWPLVPEEAQAMLQDLPRHAYELLADYECMPCGTDHRLAAPAGVLLLPARECTVRHALLADDLPLANPVPPKHVIDGFKCIDSPLTVLTAKQVRDELRVGHCAACSIRDAPRESLRSEGRILALLRYCCSDSDLSDLSGVPLAITNDGNLRTFGMCDVPLLIADQLGHDLLAALPEILLKEAIVTTAGFGEDSHAGIERLSPKRLVALLPRFLMSLDNTDRVKWDPGEDGIPSLPWLIQFYNYMADYADDCDLEDEVLRQVPLVPDQFSYLWPMGLESTPLLPSANRTQSRLVDALRPFHVPVVDGPRDLIKEIRRLVDACGDQGIWRITGRDLVDTLSAVQEEWDSPTDTFSRKIHGVVLDFLATPDANRGVKERVDKLKDLPIFPATDGGLVSLASDRMFLPAGYDLPRLDTGLGFLDVGPEGRWRPLYTALHVPALSRATFIRGILLPRYAEFKTDEQLELLQWLRTHLEEAYNELGETEGRGLNDALRSAPLVLCTDGERHPGQSLYRPDAEEAFGALLGVGVGFPDMSVYAIKKDSWFRLFERLGMQSQPQPVHLLAAIDEAAELHSTDIDRANESLRKITDYLRQHWQDLRDVVVADDPTRPEHAGAWTLLDALSKRSWLPVQHLAPRGFPRDLFCARPQSLCRPGELYCRDQLDLVSLAAPISQLELGVLGNDIGIRQSTDLSTTLRQFRAVLATVRNASAGAGVSRRTAGLLRSIYRRLGDLFPPLAQQSSELDILRDEFGNSPCILDAENVLWMPSCVFEVPVPYFLGKRAQAKARDHEVNHGLSVLGRRVEPDAHDFAEFFDDLASTQGDREIECSLRPQLRDAFRKASQCTDEDGTLHDTYVLTEEGYLKAARAVVIDDAEWLSERARSAGLLILDRQLDRQVAHAFGVSSLSRAVLERPARMSDTNDRSFASACRAIEHVIRSDAFAQGMRRLLAATGAAVRTTDSGWFRTLSVRPVDELYSELVWQDGDEAVENSEGASDVLYDPRTNSVLASVLASDVLCERVASVIAHEMRADGYALDDLSPLAAMLRSEPGLIPNLLTRLRVASLISSADDIDDQSLEDGGFIDDGLEDRDLADEPDADDGSVDDGSTAPKRPNGEGEPESSGSDGTEAESSATERPGLRSDHGRSWGDGDARSAGVPKGVAEGQQTDEPGGSQGESGQEEREDLDDVDAPGGTSHSGAGRGGGRAGSGRSSDRPSSRLSHTPRSTGQGRRAVTYVKGEGGSTHKQSKEMAEHRSEVDGAAITIVLQYERREGRSPEAMEHSNPGFDVASKNSRDEVERQIEVKGLSGAWTEFGVGVKPRQIEQCRQEPDRFWLYVVEFALEPERAQVFAVPNPVSMIDEYRFDGGWKSLSQERSGAGQPEPPALGRRVRLADSREGTVESVESRGALMRLAIRFDDGGHERMVYTPARIQVLADDKGA